MIEAIAVARACSQGPNWCLADLAEVGSCYFGEGEKPTVQIIGARRDLLRSIRPHSHIDVISRRPQRSRLCPRTPWPLSRFLPRAWTPSQASLKSQVDRLRVGPSEGRSASTGQAVLVGQRATTEGIRFAHPEMRTPGSYSLTAAKNRLRRRPAEVSLERSNQLSDVQAAPLAPTTFFNFYGVVPRPQPLSGVALLPLSSRTSARVCFIWQLLARSVPTKHYFIVQRGRTGGFLPRLDYIRALAEASETLSPAGCRRGTVKNKVDVQLALRTLPARCGGCSRAATEGKRSCVSPSRSLPANGVWRHDPLSQRARSRFPLLR